MIPEMMNKVKMVTVSDLVDNVEDIHPRDKRSAGLRLSYLALDDTYGKFVGDYKSPVFQEAYRKGDKLFITFHSVKKGLVIKGSKIEGLKISGDDGIWKEASGKIDGNKLVISINDLQSATKVSVSYCFDDDSIGNLFSTEGIPAVAFQTEVRTAK
jgi:hypothetical protein